MQRAAAVATADLDRLPAYAASFADLGCGYQQRRTLSLLEQLST